MDSLDQSERIKLIHQIRSAAGLLLVVSGGLLFLDQYLHTGWISLAILPTVGVLAYLYGIRLRYEPLIILGGILSGLGVGAVIAFTPIGHNPGILWQLGNVMQFFGLGWLSVTIATRIFIHRTAWWSLLLAGIFGSLGACLLYTDVGWADLVLYGSLGVALPLIAWGLGAKLVGLIIPGSLVVGAGPGIYMAWGATSEPNGLVQTGVMLVWFAFGWLLITVLSRVIVSRFAWWPLIPGGILAVVGCGLYIGGDPDNALGFIGNTGSIGLMIFGLYLLLMRKGIHR